jgi:triosephosphate isomerase (TIM)
MRKLLIAGNWKMHMLNHEAVSLARQLKVKLLGVHRAEVLVCPPFTALTAVAEILDDTDIRLGAQNLHDQRSGAFTGEVSGEMVRSAGGSWVLIGHSERRQFFGDTDAWINRKLHAALEAGLNPVLCVGETLEERRGGQLERVLRRQLQEGLAGITPALAHSLTLAYEPVWAIGTGVVATPEQAQETQQALRGWLGELLGADVAAKRQILYGGSVKPDNARSLLEQPDIDGALVGGASLKADEFCAIVQAGEGVVK